MYCLLWWNVTVSQSAADPEHVSSQSAAAMREELVNRWNELKAPVADRVDTLVALLDAAKVTPQMLAIYEALNTKLAARQPIAQVCVDTDVKHHFAP